MRRKDREITDFHEMIDIMKKCDSCIVAMNDGDFPYVVPMNFGLEVQGEQVFLYFHCAMEGKKLDLLKKDNRVTFEMDCDHNFILYEERMSCTMGYSSVIGHGTIDKVAIARLSSRLEKIKIAIIKLKVTPAPPHSANILIIVTFIV